MGWGRSLYVGENTCPVCVCVHVSACEWAPLGVHMHDHSSMYTCIGFLYARLHEHLCVHTCMRLLCTHLHEHPCTCVHEHSFVWAAGLQLSIGKKWLLETLTEHLTANRTAPKFNGRFSLQGSGDPKTHNPLILLTLNPKPDVLPKSGIASDVSTSLYPSLMLSICSEKSHRCWIETRLGSRLDFVIADFVTFSSPWIQQHILVKKERVVLSTQNFQEWFTLSV